MDAEEPATRFVRKHTGHLQHWCGAGFMCSCGQRVGTATLAANPEPCEICKARQIGEWAPGT